MKQILLLLIFIALLSCSKDVIEPSTCLLTKYGKVYHILFDSVSFVGYHREFVYNKRNQIVKRITYETGPTRISTVDSVVYENDLVKEVYKLYPYDYGAYVIRNKYTFFYKAGRLTSIDYYYNYGFDMHSTDMQFQYRENLEHDAAGRLTLTEISYSIPQYEYYEQVSYTYQNENLRERVKNISFVSEGDTLEKKKIVESFSNYDSMRNPFRGNIFLEDRPVAYSQNNYKEYERLEYDRNKITSARISTLSLEYNEKGYPTIGEYICN